jgi:hypothetical protein
VQQDTARDSSLHRSHRVRSDARPPVPSESAAAARTRHRQPRVRGPGVAWLGTPWDCPGTAPVTCQSRVGHVPVTVTCRSRPDRQVCRPSESRHTALAPSGWAGFPVGPGPGTKHAGPVRVSGRWGRGSRRSSARAGPGSRSRGPRPAPRRPTCGGGPAACGGRCPPHTPAAGVGGCQRDAPSVIRHGTLSNTSAPCVLCTLCVPSAQRPPPPSSPLGTRAPTPSRPHVMVAETQWSLREGHGPVQRAQCPRRRRSCAPQCRRGHRACRHARGCAAQHEPRPVRACCWA